MIAYFAAICIVVLFAFLSDDTIGLIMLKTYYIYFVSI